jgi:hypothetical protein
MDLFTVLTKTGERAIISLSPPPPSLYYNLQKGKNKCQGYASVAVVPVPAAER